jgi:hypothetical protein
MIAKAREHAGLFVILLAQFVVAFIYSGKSYFFQDDFLDFRLLQQSPLSFHLVTRSMFGHLVPAWVVSVKTFHHVFGTDYLAARWVMVILVMLATIALYRLLRALIGGSAWVVVITAVVALGAITLNSVIWWAVAMSVFASNAANIAVFGCFMRWTNTGRIRHLVGMALMYIIGTAFWEKSALTGLYVFLFALLVLDWRLGLRDRIRNVWRRWPAWIVFGVFGALDLGWYAHGSYLAEAGATPTLKSVTQMLSLSWMEGLAAGIFGIRIPDVLFFGSATLTMLIPAALVVALATYTCVKSVQARYAWAFFVLVYLINQWLLARGRIQSVGIHAGRDFRYQYDNLYLLAITVAVSLASLPPMHVGARARKVLAGCAVVLVAAVASVEVVTLNRLLDTFSGRTSRAYFEKFTTSWEQTLRQNPDAKLVNTKIPIRIMYPTFYPYSLASSVLTQVKSDVKFTSDPNGAYVVGDDGTVHPAEFVPLQSSQTPGCAVPVNGVYTFAFPAQTGDYLMAKVSYVAKKPMKLEIAVGQSPQNYTSRSKRVGTGDGEIVSPTGYDSVGFIAVITKNPADVCIKSLEIGYMK